MNFEFDYRETDSELVEMVWRTRSVGTEEFMSTAASHWEMVFTKQAGEVTLSIRGPETFAAESPVPENAEMFGIVFKLGTFMPHLPVKELVDNPQHQTAGANHSFHLYGSAWEIPNFDNVDSFIKRLIRQDMLVQDSLVNDVLVNNHVPDVSPRTVQRRFLQATGITQGTILQIERANQALKFLESGKTILDTVYLAGYADQPHLTRSLKHYVGRTPAEIVRSLETTKEE